MYHNFVSLLTICLSVLCLPQMTSAQVVSVETVTSNQVIDGTTEFHITASSASVAVATGAKVDVRGTDARLFFDNVKPNDVVTTLSGRILIDDQPMAAEENCRVVVYRHGSVVMAHGRNFRPLTTFTGRGGTLESASYLPDTYYTNAPDVHVAADMLQPLPHDNAIRSIRLKRGYAATLANEPDGMGYSRVFIADTADIAINLPRELDCRVSFIRVSKWQYASKKGWAGSIWKEVPEGLKYVTEQCDRTNSTWYYNWGTGARWSMNPAKADTTYNQEFIPEKWGAGDAAEKLLALRHVSHLIAHNEPDHSEQSNVSVAKAIEEWPQLQRTGLRLGSPATTDFSWLYSFMSEARKRNYRVDFVVIHAYWGGLSADEWYSRLKEVHDRTGRPLWIKEWNNGANWTHEGWPSGTTEQQEKQLRDLKGILQVMDTCSFVERYSIYNWVEDKRAIILPNGKLTPAGQYYTDSQPDYSLAHSPVVVPEWTVREGASLAYDSYLPDEDGLALRWEDPNGEMVSGYSLERSIDGGQSFEEVAYLPFRHESSCHAPLSDVVQTNLFRLTSYTDDGAGKTSNVVRANIIRQNIQEPFVAKSVLTSEVWEPCCFATAQKPFCLLGVPTYRNKQPLSPQIKDVQLSACDISLRSWQYQQNPKLANPDTIAVFLADEVQLTASGLPLSAITAEVSQQWSHVSFPRQFASAPVVLATVVSNRAGQAVSVRLRNVGPSGCDICLTYEEGSQPGAEVTEQINLLAIEPGEHNMQTSTGQSIIITAGLTPDAAVGSLLESPYTIGSEALSSTDVYIPFFAQMQTSNDRVCSSLRIHHRSESEGITLIKDREKSASRTEVKAEQVGWMMIQHSGNANSIAPQQKAGGGPFQVYDLQGRCIGENHTGRGFYIIRRTDGSVRKTFIKH